MKNLPYPHIAAFASLILFLTVGCGEESDTTGPRVTRTTPADGSADVPTNTLIEVTFDEKIDTSSVAEAVEASPKVVGSVTHDEATRTLILTPSESLQTGKEYVVTVSGVTDTAGNEMKAHTFRFTPGERDDGLPQVIRTIPMTDEEDVLEDTEQITIQFSERLDRSDEVRTYSAFDIRGDMRREIEIWKAKWLDTTTYGIELNTSFENDEEIVVKIDGSSIVDPAGNEMSEDYVFSFTIEGIDPVERPRNYPSRTLAFIIWQGTSGEWHIRWNSNLVQKAPALQTSPSEPQPPPKPNPKPKPRPYGPEYHYFSGTIVSDGLITAGLDPYSFSNSDLIRMEANGNLVTVFGDGVIVERDEASTVTVRAHEVTVDGDIGDMVSMTEDTVTVVGDIVTIVDGMVAIEGSIMTVKGDKITVKGDGGSIMVAEGSVLNVEGNFIVLQGELISLDGSALVVEGDVLIVQGNEMWFAGSTSDTDPSGGFDFRSDGVYLTFDIKIDNEYNTRDIFIGEKGKSPRDIPFDLKSRYQYSGL